MSKDNEPEKKGEEAKAAATAATAAVEKWINEIIAPVRMTIAAALPRASPEERAAVLARALEFLPGPEMAGQAEQKEAPAAASGAMEPLRPDAGNGDAALAKALEALEWRQSKNGKGEWILVATPSGEPAGPFAGPPLRGFLERVKAAPAGSGLLFGGYRYRLHEGKFLHRWPLKRA
jgi:hypothetical protein